MAVHLSALGSDAFSKEETRTIVTERPLRTESVAIVGFSDTSRDLAPWGDETWEKWICNRLGVQPGITIWDRHFDPHPWVWTVQHFTPELAAEYEAFLKKDWGPARVLYHPDALGPNSVAFPVEECIKFSGRSYFTNVIAYQIIYAAHLGAKRIGLWGIDLRTDTEYGYERPNVEWALGFAEGRGIEIVFPDVCALLNNDGFMPLYGVSEKDTPLADFDRLVSNRIADIEKHLPILSKKNDDALIDIYRAEGAQLQAKQFLECIRHARRGGKLLNVPPIGK